MRFGFFSGPSSPEPWHPLWYRNLSPPLFCHLICTRLCKQEIKKKIVSENCRKQSNIRFLRMYINIHRKNSCTVTVHKLSACNSWPQFELWMSFTEIDEVYSSSILHSAVIYSLLYWFLNSLWTCVTSLILHFSTMPLSSVLKTSQFARIPNAACFDLFLTIK